MPAARFDRTGALDGLFDVLSHPYRRRILIRLHDRNPREESSFSTDSVGEEGVDTDRLGIELHHHHLPKLEAAGFIDWDRDADAIRRGPRFDEIAPLLDLMDRHSDELPQDWP